MKDQIMDLELTISRNCNFTEKAWHLASILLFLRRPASIVELVERCSLFRTSPELVKLLCSIPNSPIYLAANDFVVLSTLVFSAFGEIFHSSIPKFELLVYGGNRMLRGDEDFMRTYFRKRKKLGNELMPTVKRRVVLRSIDENMPETVNLSENQRIASTCLEGSDLQTAHSCRASNALSYEKFPKEIDLVTISEMDVISNVVNSSTRLLDNFLEIHEDQGTSHKQNTFVVNDMDLLVTEGFQDKFYIDETFLDLPNYHVEMSTALSEKMAELSAVLAGNEVTNLVNRIDTGGPSCVELNQNVEKLTMDTTAVINTPKNFSNSQMQETKMEYMSKQLVMDNADPEERVGVLPFGSSNKVPSPAGKLCHRKLPSNKEITKIKSISQPLASVDPQSSARKPRRKSSTIDNVLQEELPPKPQNPSKVIQNNTIDIIDKEMKDQTHQKANVQAHKSKHNAKNKAYIHEKCENLNKVSKDQPEPNFPEFEAYAVEQEEGSGGYGTVYRAIRKTDGMTFAIKCPHTNAQKHHVKNELKMLKRFGGKNYVIKLECSLKSENSDCFVLQHVEHDRPEVLKKEIDISQLQWYGYCMFKALVGLHKQDVFHRDIKPGNFLFSSKSLNGYLIDFNLAKDMDQKRGNIEKLQPKSVKDIQQVPSVHSKSTSPNQQKKSQGFKFSPFKEVAVIGRNSVLGSKTLKKKVFDKVKAYEDLGCRNSPTSQGADGSGVTSTRDMTSNRTPSVERFRDRQPLPCKGRKALINLAQEAMQNPNLGALKAPASNRKRIAASPGFANRKLIYPTPTPLHSSGVAVSGAGTLSNKGDVKPIKDGPCVGTKGFRAPEVLLRSLYQGPKIDVWSAGVTLLYLISGKMPFSGDPEQNMKDIVKLKGNEELWEVAKLHDRESSLPMELLDISFSQSMTIKEWCLTNTRRPDLLDVIPDSLYDLLEKCLTVSPRLRISAQEALNHEFFVPCQEVVHKRRLLRYDGKLDSKRTLLPLLSEPVRPHREKLVDPVNF